MAIDWLRQLFELPEEFTGVLVTGGSTANFACLAAARDWCVERLGGAPGEDGLASLPQILVLTSGHAPERHEGAGPAGRGAPACGA